MPSDVEFSMYNLEYKPLLITLITLSQCGQLKLIFVFFNVVKATTPMDFLRENC